MGYIYKITNTIDGKVYVGQTKRTPEIRWNEHVETKDKYRTIFSHALREYPEDVFEIDIIEEVPNDVLDEREQYWIKHYDSFSTGYNGTLGGHGRRYLDHEAVRGAWNDGLSVGEITKKYGCGKSTARRIVQTQDSYNTKESYLRGERHNYRSVNKYDLDGSYICTYDSIINAARDVDCDAPGIVNVCNGMNLTCGGYQWRYTEDEAPGEYHNPIYVAVDQYDLDGKYLRTFDSIVSAANYIGVNKTNIGKACRGELKTCAGYQWRHVNDEPPEPYVSGVYKAVVMCDLDWKPLERYTSMREAADAVHADVSSICACCNGRRKTCKGYRWRYADE